MTFAEYGNLKPGQLFRFAGESDMQYKAIQINVGYGPRIYHLVNGEYENANDSTEVIISDMRLISELGHGDAFFMPGYCGDQAFFVVSNSPCAIYAIDEAGEFHVFEDSHLQVEAIEKHGVELNEFMEVFIFEGCVHKEIDRKYYLNLSHNSIVEIEPTTIVHTV